MKGICLVVLLLMTLSAEAQVVNWKDVEVREFTRRFSEEDSIGKGKAEWFERGEASTLSELSSGQLKRIKKKTARWGCDLAYVDIKGVYKRPRKGLYVLAVKRY